MQSFKIEQLEACVQTASASENVSLLAVDDSSLSQASKLIDDLTRQLDVRERTLDAEVRFADLIPVENNEVQGAANILDSDRHTLWCHFKKQRRDKNE